MDVMVILHTTPGIASGSDMLPSLATRMQHLTFLLAYQPTTAQIVTLFILVTMVTMADLQQLFFGLRNGSDFGHHNAAPVGST